MLKGGLAAKNDLKRGVSCGGKTSSEYWDRVWRDPCWRTGVGVWSYCAKRSLVLLDVSQNAVSVWEYNPVSSVLFPSSCI